MLLSTTPPTPTTPPGAPGIGEALRFLRMSGVFYSPSDLTEPWGLSIPAMEDCVWFHVVTEGWCHVEVGGEVVELVAGQLALVPHGTGHRGWGRVEAPTPNVLDLPHDEVSEHYANLRHGGGGAACRLVCGGVRFDHPGARHLIDALPPLVVLGSGSSLRMDWLRSTLELLAEELAVVRPGSDAVISRLCDIVVIQGIRAWMERDPAAREGWLGALRDERLGGVLARIHADPGADWSVASLAADAAMSRSAFAAHFTALVGEPAMRYVTRWRMYVAADRLRTEPITVAEAARSVGYDSEAAFSRAFKRLLGVSPSAVRDR